MARPRNSQASDATRDIGLLIEASGAYARGLIRGISAFAQTRRSWRLHLFERVGSEDARIWLKHSPVDGAIARVCTPKIAAVLARHKIPVVNVSGSTTPPQWCRVDTDNDAICALAVGHLIERGYRTFGYCGMPSHEWSRWRRESFTAVLKRQTISCECIDLSSLTAASLGSEKDRRSLERWLMMLPKPVGILACNDHCGRILLELCDNLRLRVPDQVGVMGVDNDDLDCELSRPPMTSIEPNHERIGYAAAETLEQMLEGQNTDSPKLIRPKMLVARGSTDATAIREPLMAEALRFIRAYACKGVSIIDVSLHVGVSRRSLEAQFRQFVGRSVHTEIQRVRLEAAQRLLGETDWKLDLVAERSGFKTAAHLSALFYDKLQLRPGEYRKRIQSRSQSS